MGEEGSNVASLKRCSLLCIIRFSVTHFENFVILKLLNYRRHESEFGVVEVCSYQVGIVKI